MNKEKLCWEIVAYLRKNGKTTGSVIAKHFNVSEQEIRETITQIRENNRKFFNPTNEFYLIADSHGYWFSKHQETKEKYGNKLVHNIQSKQKQLKELLFTIK